MSQGKTTERVSLLDAWSPETDAGRRAIHEQLERLLANARFKNSKRCPSLLRYLVEYTLEGRTEHLRERALGIDVFGRPQDYDTNADPIVRATAGDIRKRIAQYYHEPGHENEIRIDLPSGSYVPEFRLPPVKEPDALTRGAWLRQWWKPLALAGMLVAAAAAVALLRPSIFHSPLERFWAPVVDSSNSVLICVGPADKLRVSAQLEARAASGAAQAMPDTAPSLQDLLSIHDVALQDATTLARVAILVNTTGRSFRIQSDDATTFSDLRSSPSVLIGAFNNAWTLRSARQLRFTFEMDAVTNRYWIRDRQNPARKDWEIDMGLPYTKLTEDYAVVGRFMNPSTERMTVIAAGIGQYGTMAAGEFLTGEKYMKDLAARAPANWEHKNFEGVIATRVIDGSTGPPRVLATWFW
ncbi:MAG: hypothetical protein ABSF98_10005 [Bryobacteraceae bacterium]|jgi:hypothetical protein